MQGEDSHSDDDSMRLCRTRTLGFVTSALDFSWRRRGRRFILVTSVERNKFRVEGCKTRFDWPVRVLLVAHCDTVSFFLIGSIVDSDVVMTISDK